MSVSGPKLHAFLVAKRLARCRDARLKTDQTEAASRGGRTSLIVFLLFALIALPFTLGLAMTRGLSHDEHQHIAAGMMWGREGLLPYRDFPLFHTPYLTYIYGALFRLTEYPLLTARLFAAVCATALVAMLGVVAFRAFRARGDCVAWRAAFVTVGLALAADLFTQGAGRAWNLEPSLLLAVGAVLALERGLMQGKRAWLALAGGLLGLAIGMRITYAPLIAPLGLATLLGAAAWPHRLRTAAAFSAGLLAGLSGVFALYALDREAFMFGNFEFPQVNIEYRLATGEPRTMTLAKKLRYFWKEIVREDPGIFIAALTPCLILGWLAWRKVLSIPPALKRLALAAPFILWGVLAPSPVFPQYFFALLPFLLLAGIWALVALPVASAARRWSERTALAGLVLAVVMHSREYEGMSDLMLPREWVPFEIHEEAMILRAKVPAGSVLTLAPILPIEAGLEIDPAFATGAFAWRVAPFIDADKADRLDLPTPATLAAHLANRPPSAVLVGFEETGEELFIEHAKKRGFVETPLEEEERLWTPPLAVSP